MTRIVLLALLTAFAFGCKSDNASPHAHGAGNKPSDVTKGETKSEAPPSNMQNQTQTTGTGEYGGSSGQAGGVRSDTALGGGGTSTQPATNTSATTP